MKKVNDFVEEYPWCEVCNLPYIAEQCMNSQGCVEEKDHEDEYEPTMNVISSDPFRDRDEDSSEDKQSSNVQWRRESQQYNIQQVFTDDDVDAPALRRLVHDEDPVHSLRNLTDEEKKVYTVAAVAQEKSNYQLRNRIVNPEKGKPSGIFAKVPKASGNKDTITNEEKEGAEEKMKQTEPPKLTKPIERKQISKPLSNCGSFMS